MATLSWALNVKVGDGAPLAVSHSTDVEAVDQIEVVVPAVPKTTVNVSPGVADDIKFLLIRLKETPPYPPKLTYKVGTKGPYTLDAPQLFSGVGAVSLLGADPTQLVFSNDAANPQVTVQILVGRDATP